jgi:predicted metal-dependent peptidase
VNYHATLIPSEVITMTTIIKPTGWAKDAKEKKAPFTRAKVPMTKQQEQKATETRAKFLAVCPAFAHVYYTMCNKDALSKEHTAIYVEPDGPLQWAATDGINIYVTEKFYNEFDLNERVFVMAHEVLHCVFNHCALLHTYHRRGKVHYSDGTSHPYIPLMMNLAQDYVINAILVESKVGKMPKFGCHDLQIATAEDSTVEVYRKLFQKAEDEGRIVYVDGGAACSGPGEGEEGKGFDVHLPPGTGAGKNADQSVEERKEGDWQQAVAAGIAAARAQGNSPACIERVFGELLNPTVDWREHLATVLPRRVGSSSNDWRRPDRRLIVRDIYSPGRSGFGAGTVVVACDTSGSIGPKEVDLFFGQLVGVFETLKPKQVVVMWCDAKVHRVDYLEDVSELDHVRSEGAPGGGGTSFVPVFEKIDELGLDKVDGAIYLTDGHGSFPASAPSYPVIWGSIDLKPEGFPFGDVVMVPLVGEDA